MGSMMNMTEKTVEEYRARLKRERNEELARWLATPRTREESLALLYEIGDLYGNDRTERGAV